MRRASPKHVPSWSRLDSDEGLKPKVAHVSVFFGLFKEERIQYIPIVFEPLDILDVRMPAPSPALAGLKIWIIKTIKDEPRGDDEDIRLLIRTRLQIYEGEKQVWAMQCC